MSPEEKSELATLRYEVNEGFREVRALLESRRVQEELAHHDIHARVSQQGERLREHVDEVKHETSGRLRTLERVAWTATLLGGAGTLIGVELLRRVSISF